jgi:hypothetical protein
MPIIYKILLKSHNLRNKGEKEKDTDLTKLKEIILYNVIVCCAVKKTNAIAVKNTKITFKNPDVYVKID